MKQINLDINNKNQIEKISIDAAKILQNGGFIIYPTDTLYGLGASAFNENAIKKIYKIKKQDRNKPISVIVKDFKMARKIACIDSKVERILNNIWPGPITVILRKKDSIPYSLTANKENIAVRIPQSEFISRLMEYIDFPITATSANISGEKDLYLPEEIIKTFKKNSVRPDLFINSGNVNSKIASTIIDLTSNIPKIIRIGVAGKENMENFFNKFNLN